MKTYAYKKNSLRRLAKMIDVMGSHLALSKKPLPPHPHKILVVRLDQLGDVMQTLPLLVNLRSHYPTSQIHVLTTPAGAELLRAFQAPDNVITWNSPWFDSRRKSDRNLVSLGKQLGKEKYDLVFELRGDIRLMAWLKWFLKSPIVGYGATGGGFLLDKEVPWNPFMPAVNKNLALLQSLGLPIDPAVEIPPFLDVPVTGTVHTPFRLLVHPDAGTNAKKWPLENFAHVISTLLEQKEFSISLIGTDLKMGGKLESECGNRVTNLMGKTTIQSLLDIMKESDGLLTNDSGPAHMMAALGKPVWILWSGTADPHIWAPRGKVTLMENKVSCSYCSLNECPLPHHPCLTQISPDHVCQIITRSRCSISPATA